MLLDIYLEAHDSILSKIFVSLGTGWSLIASDVLEEHIERWALDGLPSEHGISSGQHRCEAEERFTSLVWCVTKLIFIVLSNLDHVG